MKNPVNKLLMIVALLGVTLQSCKKDDQDEQAQLNSEFKQFNDDSNYYKEASDQSDDDVNNIVSDIPAFGRVAKIQSNPLCGATLDTSQLAQKIIFVNFDGVTPCFTPSRTRHGQIKVQLTTGTYWSDVNSVLTITYINFKVTRLSDNKSITFNGVKTLKNINGNDWFGFFAETATLKYQSRAFGINVLYDNGQTAVWNSTRLTEWSYNDVTPNGLSIPTFHFSCNGDTTINGYSTVDSWGVNRFGQNFTTYYNAPWVSDSYCGLWRPTSGELTHNVNNANFVLTLGVDQSGNASTLDCAYGFKVSWTVNGNTQVAVLSY